MSTAIDPTTPQPTPTTEPVETADAATSGDLETVRLVNGLSCELPADSPLAKLLKSQRTWTGPDAKQRLRILDAANSVAIVGASPKPQRSSYFVGTYLQQSSDYRLYFAGSAVSFIGTWMQQIAAYWLVLELTGSPVAVGALALVQTLPVTAFALVGGAIVVGAVSARAWLQLGSES